MQIIYWKSNVKVLCIILSPINFVFSAWKSLVSKVFVSDENRAEFMNIVAQAGATIMDVNDKTYTVKIDGDEKKVQTFAELVRPYGIKEFVRSGKVAITKGNQFSNIKNLTKQD